MAPDLPQELLDAAHNFTASFRVTDDLSDTEYWTLWEGKFDASAGVTGLWFPYEDWMVVTNRQMSHHNVAYRNIHKQEGALSPVMPWAANSSGGNWHVDIPASAGGMTQVLHRIEGGEDVESWQYGHNIHPQHLWPVLYTCRLLDIPDTAVVMAKFAHPRMASADPNYHEQETFVLEDAYTEMRFSPAGIPEPSLDRQQYL